MLNRFAYAKNGDLAIGTLDYKRKYYIDRSIHLGEHVHKICYQAQTTTFAVLCSKSKLCSEDPEKHFVHLLDDQSFHLKSTYPLDTFEHGRSIISCSFSDDNDVYYCIRTAHVFPQQNEATKVSLQLPNMHFFFGLLYSDILPASSLIFKIKYREEYLFLL